MKTIRVVAAIIRKENKIFATQRGYGDFKDGWEFPGGKIEEGESPEHAIAREIKEELNADIIVGDLLTTVEYDYPNFHLSMDCFWAELAPDSDIKLLEHEAAKWLSIEEIDSVDWLPADVEVMKMIKANNDKCSSNSLNRGGTMSISRPRWKQVEYSRNQIIKAGKTIRKSSDPKEKEHAREIIDNWRVAHAFPMQVIYMHLKRMASGNKKILVAQRLKRLDSIVGKLMREPSMSLWSMQDLGGCRFIVPSINDVYDYYDKYRRSRIRHIFVDSNDYIANPKPSGYRSLHAVYKYHSDQNDKYNNNMLIEIQFRTHLQHLWATAVETMGLFKNVAIKSGEGDADVNRFFALVSSLFAIEEGMPVVPNTPEDPTELVNEIRQLDAKNNYLNFLTSIRVANKFEEDNSKANNNEYCVMSLNYNTYKLSIKRFKSSEIEEANIYYTELEKKQLPNTDTVLVRVSSFSALESA